MDEDRGRYRRLQWITIVSPTVFVAVAETIRYLFLRRLLSPGDVSLVAVLITFVGAVIFSTYVFSEVERLEQQRRAFKDAMMALRERERLAREMHDGLAQNLAAINLKVHRAQRLLETERWEAIADELTEIQSAVHLSYGEVRQSLYDLKASKGVVGVDREGFWQTLLRQAQDFSEHTGIPTRIDPLPDQQEPWNELVSVEILRIIQESLANVRKHSEATAVKIDAVWHKGAVLLCIRDDGRGFEPSGAARLRHHFGLSVMKERAESVGGRLSIDSSPGRGTTVSIEIPISGRGGNPGGKSKAVAGG